MKQAILQTLCYHDLFDYPLALEEIHRFLIGNSKFKMKNSKLKLQIKNLIQIGKVEEKKGFYFLQGRGKIVSIRKKREKISQKKLKIAQRTADWLRLIPNVKMVAITGAMAMENAEKDEDIDLLVITSKNRLWLTRIQAVLLIELLGNRRRLKDVEVTDKICLNIFLDESRLQMPKEKQNLFVAHEMAQMKVLWQRDDLYQKFLKANLWLKKFLPNWKN